MSELMILSWIGRWRLAENWFNNVVLLLHLGLVLKGEGMRNESLIFNGIRNIMDTRLRLNLSSVMMESLKMSFHLLSMKLTI